MKTTRRKIPTTPKREPTLPRIFIKENQEFVMNGNVFIWNIGAGGWTNLVQIAAVNQNEFSITTITP